MKEPVMRSIGVFAAIIFLTMAFTCLAEDLNGDGYVSVLLPIAFSASQVLPGAYGTQWAEEIWVHNGSSVDIRSLQPTGNCIPSCSVAEFPVGFLGRMSSVESNNNNGAMFHLPVAAGSNFHLSARLLELTRRAQPTGVDVPMAQEGAFLTGTRWILAVPVGDGVRSALRVYDPWARKGTSLAVDFFDPDGALVASTVLRPGDDPLASDSPAGPLPRPVPTVAGALDLTSQFPVLRGLDRFHIRITPPDPVFEYWVMASVTDNETQHVLLITAQP
jgi:hypothetical protein